ncbi:uroporphyrinogen decarboxylase [Candidatus Epulonipiscium fishelsonii]|uniref:Uroporphyrinogen decarboxylase n=1 Tax=Candidatus Epulonipiscium fishelsonii TaxID=77094 RepID=A0ACC8X9K7_9FIRM|nr:uroporphyrinogen decarboxylase [Epulopiscium sp. SCG-B11WGA-EpuloA1]ONI41872.1 uroporphyrinogen decarboxylase [Epulopiscium sp. SCG-B05WGA-EpuloA1]
MSLIEDIKIEYYKLPLKGNLVDALHGRHDFFEVIIANVLTEDGINGVGYTYTGGIGGVAIAKMLEFDLVPKMLGKEIENLSALNLYMNNAIHYVARGGIASFAISALDIACWDVWLKEQNKSLADAFGTRQPHVKTYHGGIDLMLSEYELLHSIEEKLLEGHTAIKIKVGKSNMQEDISRVKAVRNLIGKDAWFAVDANMVMSVEQAIKFANAIEQYDIAWFEEPTNPDKYYDYAEIAKNTSIPIAMGENLHTHYEHELALDIGNVKEIIPDCSNVCGISGFFEVAKLAKDRGLKVNSHGMQELHLNVLGAVDNAGYVEAHSFPIWEYANEPLLVRNGLFTPSFNAGTGVSFNLELLNKANRF